MREFTTAYGRKPKELTEDALRVTVKPHPSEMQEALQYSFEDLKPESATVTMTWDKLAVPFRIAVNDQATVLPYIRRQMRGLNILGPPNEAAQYVSRRRSPCPVRSSGPVRSRPRSVSKIRDQDVPKAMGKTDEAGKSGNTPWSSPNWFSSTPMPGDSAEA